MGSLRLRGIHYDIGTTTLDGGTTRPSLEAAQVEREIADIAEGLHANAVRITGGDASRLRLAGEAAVRHGLEPWLSPMLPNADAPTTLRAIESAASIAEDLRASGARSVLVVGCELSAFMSGILPGEDHAARLALLTDMSRLVAEVDAQGIDPQARFDAFLADAVRVGRARFKGAITYASGPWETVPWAEFDLVGVDAYRDVTSRDTYVERLRARRTHGLPVVVTEFGCATYAGAGDLGSMAWIAVDRTPPPGRLRGGVARDEAAQAAELGDQLDAISSAGIEGAFLYTYVAPSYPASAEPDADLDTASYALLRSWPDGRTDRKLAYETVAARFAELVA